MLERKIVLQYDILYENDNTGDTKIFVVVSYLEVFEISDKNYIVYKYHF